MTKVLARRRSGARSSPSAALGLDLSTVVPFTAAYSSEGAGFRSLAVASGGAVEQWPSEVGTTGAYLDGNKLVMGGSTTGIVGDVCVTPDSAATSVTSDITLVGYFTAADWTTGVARYLISKFNTTGDQRSYTFLLTSADRLQFTACTDGTAVTIQTATSSVAPTLTDGVGYWLSVTWRASDGRVQFFVSSDSVTTDPASVSWTQVGTDAFALAVSIFDSTANVVVGSVDGTFLTTPFAGSCSRAQIRTGSTISSSVLAADMNPQNRVHHTASWLASTGERWKVYSSSALTHQTAANQPSLALASANFNNRDVVSFDGSNDRLRAVVVYGAEPPSSVVLIARYRAVPAATTTAFSTSTAQATYGIGTTAAGVLQEIQGAVVSGATTVPTTAAMFRWDFQASGGTSVLYLNEVAVASGNVAAVIWDRFQLGGGTSGTACAYDVAFLGIAKDGDIAADPKWGSFKAALRAKYRIALP